jgi:hypothetical protein
LSDDSQITLTTGAFEASSDVVDSTSPPVLGRWIEVSVRGEVLAETEMNEIRSLAD